MATYATLNTTTATMQEGNRYTPATDTYDSTRGFYRFDQSGYFLSPLGLTTNLQETVTANSGSTDYQLRSDNGSNNWGTGSLGANQTTLESTNTNAEELKTIGATGTYTFSVNSANLGYGGTTWFRLASTNEGSTTSKSITTGAQEHTTAASRPQLLFDYQRPWSMAMMGVSSKVSYALEGNSADGNVRATEISSAPATDTP